MPPTRISFVVCNPGDIRNRVDIRNQVPVATSRGASLATGRRSTLQLLACSMVLVAGVCASSGCSPRADRSSKGGGVCSGPVRPRRLSSADESKILAGRWETIDAAARGETVRMAMWDGDPMINAYMHQVVAPRLKDDFDITLQPVGLSAGALVNKLIVEREAGRSEGDIDVAWINGENFYHLRQIDALFGPFTDRLPNNRFIDWNDRFIAFDFQKPVEGFECPWGNVQWTLICRSDRIADPPRTIAKLEEWIVAHPGRFTFDNSFTGMTFLKCLMSEFAGGRGSLDGPFDAAKYVSASQRLWDFLRRVQPHLWREGRTFPTSVSQLHQLFANDEVDFTMSNNDGEVDNKVLQGVLPETARAYVFESGTIRNSHYLGIPRNSTRKAAALVVVNYLISPEAQWRKSLPDVWGDGTVLDVKRLPEDWRERFRTVPGRTRVAPREELERDALMEPAPELMIRLHEDFRREIIERGN